MSGAAESLERTFLATDVVGSTALHRRFPADMLAAMDLHDAIVAATVQRHGGEVFKHTGDGVNALFPQPQAALKAALDLVRALREAPWGPTGPLRVRSGVHRGLARPRGGDYFGPALPTVTRLCGAAHGEQVLVSADTVAALGAAAGGFVFTDLGEHHFKGIDPLRVLQASPVGEAVPAHPPIGGKRESANGNLPTPMTSFFGREDALRQLLEMTHDGRLITLIGPGGIGKTRLAIEFARSLETSFPDGAWFVDLSVLERGADVWPAIAASLLLEPMPGTPRRTQVLERLQEARALLVMDNCEHVMEPACDAVAELGAACPALFIVNTSRRTLGVDGEALFEVSPLREAGAGGAGGDASERLFVARARLADHRFQPGTEEQAAIRSLCERLEHLPLAIEIAASQLRRLSVNEIAAGMSNPLDLGNARAPRRAGRQQTLRATLDWSYELLDSGSRRMLELLSVFSGPFHEEQALALCEGAFEGAAGVLDGLEELLASSLLLREGSGTRVYRMLQTVQAFGREKLQQAGRLLEAEQRHGRVFADRCHELARQVAGDREAAAIQAVFDQVANLRAAFERALQRDLPLAAEIADALFLFNYAQRGAETARWPRRVVEQPGAEALPQITMLLAGAAVNAFHDEGDSAAALAFVERGLRLEAAGAPSSEGWLAGVAGQIAQWTDDTAHCLQQLNTAAEQARAAGNLACEITSLCMSAYVHARSGDFAAADALSQRVSALGQRTAQPTLLGYVHYARGRVHSYREPLKAIDEYSISVEWALMGGNLLGAQRVRHFIAELQAAAAPPREALAIYLRALAEIPSHGATFYAWSTVRAALVPLAALGADEAVVTLAAALGRSPVKPGRKVLALVNSCRARLSAVAAAHAEVSGRNLDLPAARTALAAASAALQVTTPIPLPKETTR